VVNTFSFQKICKWYAEGKSNKVSRNEEKAGNKFKKIIEHGSYIFQIALRTSIKIYVILF
jgi:hypothetical protein